PDAFGESYEAYLAFVPAGEREAIDRTVKAFLAEPPATGVIHYDHPIITGDGQDRWIEVRGTLYRDDQGRLTRMTGICTDITDRKHEEAEKKYLQQQFHQTQKLESVGRLAGGVAHDLNNLLSPILGYSEMLIDEAPPGGPWVAPLKEILKAGFRARDLVRQLLAFSRKQALDFTSVDLNALLKDFENLLRRTIREDIVIQMNLASALPSIKGDMGQLEQVVMNLAVNAQDAMPEGGRLTIETTSLFLDEAYAAEHRGSKPGPYVMLLVSDTGHGMDLRTRELIFEPFFTTKEVNAGTGLGLATVYGIIKQHGGNIWVYSEPEMGTTFRIYLPVSDEVFGQEEPSLPAVSDLSGSETIFLVEDNEQVRDLALAILQHAGYTVLSASGGKEALERLSHYSGPLHLLLTDVIMPGINGRQLFSRAADLFPGLKVLYMSGYTAEVIAHHGIMDEGIDFIQKPFSVQALVAKVREVLDR
ncbi:MAG: ATP-binding protein, partial [Desulfosarcinaceae bacterium]